MKKKTFRWTGHIRAARHDLVHAAGCVKSNCPKKERWYLTFLLDNYPEARVPRRLREPVFAPDRQSGVR